MGTKVRRTIALLLAVLMVTAGAFVVCGPAAYGAETVQAAEETYANETAYEAETAQAAEEGISKLLKRKSLRTSLTKNEKGKVIDYRVAAGQKASTYRCFQGSCSDGEYSYHALFYKKKNRCRIIKVDPKTNKVMKVSKGYKLYHGNDLTYDSKRGRLVVVHGDGDTKRVSILDPETLKRKKTVRIKFKGKLPGASKKFVSGIKGITDISYDEKTDTFVCSIKKTLHFVVLDKNFKPKKVLKVKSKKYMTKQGSMVSDGRILRVMCNLRGHRIQNYIYVYDMKGKYLKKDKGKDPLRVGVHIRYQRKIVRIGFQREQKGEEVSHCKNLLNKDFGPGNKDSRALFLDK